MTSEEPVYPSTDAYGNIDPSPRRSSSVCNIPHRTVLRNPGSEVARRTAGDLTKPKIDSVTDRHSMVSSSTLDTNDISFVGKGIYIENQVEASGSVFETERFDDTPNPGSPTVKPNTATSTSPTTLSSTKSPASVDGSSSCTDQQGSFIPGATNDALKGHHIEAECSHTSAGSLEASFIPKPLDHFFKTLCDLPPIEEQPATMVRDDGNLKQRPSAPADDAPSPPVKSEEIECLEKQLELKDSVNRDLRSQLNEQEAHNSELVCRLDTATREHLTVRMDLDAAESNIQRLDKQRAAKEEELSCATARAGAVAKTLQDERIEHEREIVRLMSDRDYSHRRL